MLIRKRKDPRVYKLKMFFIWIFQKLVDFAIDNKEALLGTLLAYLIVGSLVWAIADLDLMKGMLTFMRYGWFHDLVSIPTYIGLLIAVIFGIGWIVVTTFMAIVNFFREKAAEFNAFTIEGPNKKKKHEKPERAPIGVNGYHPSDHMDDYYDENGEFETIRYQKDISVYLDDLYEKTYGQKKKDSV